MDTSVDNQEVNRELDVGRDAYRDTIRKLLNIELKNALDTEWQKAAEEIKNAQRQAIASMLDEHRSIIQQVVEEEKKKIHKKVDALRKSVLDLGL